MIVQQAVHLGVVGAGIIVALMFVLWLIHLPLRNAAVIDVGWALGLAVLALYYAYAGPGYKPRKYALAVMVGFWGFRLAVYLLFSRVIGHPEEGRYVQLRKEWKRHLGLRFLFFFEFQALLDVILSTPFLIAALNPHAPLGFLENFGAGIWLVSMIGEGIADRQLYYFKKNPENASKTCREGLWKYSRHPNYFFDWMTWVGYAVFALGSPWGWIGLISPALVLYFLLDVTGIPATEAQALRSRGDEYREYQRTTSSFVPWFPKKSEAKS